MSYDEKTLDLWREMLRVRLIEEAIVEHYPEQEMRCPTHLSIGQEAAAVGVCHALHKSDWVFSGHTGCRRRTCTGCCTTRSRP